MPVSSSISSLLSQIVPGMNFFLPLTSNVYSSVSPQGVVRDVQLNTFCDEAPFENLKLSTTGTQSKTQNCVINTKHDLDTNEPLFLNSPFNFDDPFKIPSYDSSEQENLRSVFSFKPGENFIVSCSNQLIRLCKSKDISIAKIEFREEKNL